jgi:hypothetical protein
MSGTTRTIRTATKRRLHAIIRQRVPAERAVVSYGRPTGWVEGDLVMVGKVEGADGTGIPNQKSTRKQMDDRYQITVLFTAWAAGAEDDGAADERVEELFELVRDQLVEDPTLGRLPGLVHAIPSRIDGPEGWPGEDGTGRGSAMQLTIDCFARIT